jgi:hypothetical protein
VQPQLICQDSVVGEKWNTTFFGERTYAFYDLVIVVKETILCAVMPGINA